MKKAQSTLEFTFAMIVILFLIYGMVQVFRWSGMDLAQRRFAFDNSITADPGADPAKQLSGDFDRVQPMAASYHGTVADGNTSQ